MKIAVLDDYSDTFRTFKGSSMLAAHEVVAFHKTETDPRKLGRMLEGFDAVILTLQRSWFNRAIIEQLNTVRLISQVGDKVAHIDVPACTERGIVVSAGAPPGLSAEAAAAPTAELTWALVLAAMRNLPDEVARMKAGGWQGSVGTALHGKTLGVYGYGKLGSLVAGYGRAFGMNVICWGREGTLSRARADGFAVAASREAFFADSDVLSLHIRLLPETVGIVTAQDLARMKPTALLVNTGRAKLIEKGALVQALQQGRPGKAAVDVYEEEPVTDTDHPLLRMKNVICSPHLGYVEARAMDAYYEGAARQILAWADGKPINVVNPAALG